MSSIFDLAREGAEDMQQLRQHGEDATLRANIDRLAREISHSWTLDDIERIEGLPPYFCGVSLGPLGAYVKLVVRGTNGVIAVDARDWAYRLIHHFHTEKK